MCKIARTYIFRFLEAKVLRVGVALKLFRLEGGWGIPLDVGISAPSPQVEFETQLFPPRCVVWAFF